MEMNNLVLQMDWNRKMKTMVQIPHLTLQPQPHLIHHIHQPRMKQTDPLSGSDFPNGLN